MRILLAEDENKTRERIARTLNSMDIVDEVFQAENGEIALEIINRENIDLIITDICMPKMSGLDVIKTIREKGDATEVIIMSGYNDFEYARKALKYNVIDYILKPVNPIELKTQMQEVAERIRKKSFETRNARTPFFSKLIRSTEINTAEILKEMTDLNLPKNSNLYAVSFITFKSKDKLQINALQKELEEIIEENPIENLKVYPFTYQGSEEALIYMFDNYTEQNAVKAIRILNDIIGYRLEECHNIFTTAISSYPVHTLYMLPEAGREARLRSIVELDFSTHSIFISEEGNETGSAETIDDRIRDAITSLPSLIDEDSADAIKKITALIYLFQKQALMDIQACKNNFSALKNALKKSMEENSGRMDIETIKYDVELLDSHERLTETYQRLLRVISELMEARAKEKIPISEKISRYIKERIENNLSNENFSVTDAIEGLNYSENYIRYIFSNHEGMTIKEYLTVRRIERAKDLLLKGVQIKKIAEMTGYNNQRYFARCFKAFVGQTPTEWRDRATEK